MGELSTPNPALVRKVWDSMPNPSTRRVARKLRQAGISLSHMTVARWRRRGWRPLERQRHPFEVARQQLDDAVPMLTGDPMTVAEDLVTASAERAELENLPKGALLHRAARALAADVVAVGDAFLRQPEIVISRPGEIAILVRALTACAQAVSAAFAQHGMDRSNPPIAHAHRARAAERHEEGAG